VSGVSAKSLLNDPDRTKVSSSNK